MNRVHSTSHRSELKTKEGCINQEDPVLHNHWSQHTANLSPHLICRLRVGLFIVPRDPHGVDGMVVGFTTSYAISTYHHWRCEFVPETTLCDEVCKLLAAGRWFSLGTPVSFSNNTDYHDIAEILLKVTLNTIVITLR